MPFREHMGPSWSVSTNTSDYQPFYIAYRPQHIYVETNELALLRKMVQCWIEGQQSKQAPLGNNLVPFMCFEIVQQTNWNFERTAWFVTENDRPEVVVTKNRTRHRRTIFVGCTSIMVDVAAYRYWQNKQENPKSRTRYRRAIVVLLGYPLDPLELCVPSDTYDIICKLTHIVHAESI